MESQYQLLKLTKVKTGNAGFTCYMANKIDIFILFKKAIINHKYLLYELFNKIKESRIFFIILHMLLHTSYLYLMEENNTFVKQVFLMLIQKKFK